MRNTILILLLAICGSGFAQDPEIVGTWYLKAFTVDLGDPEFIDPTDAPQNPTLVIYPDYSFEGIGACNTFTGQLEYDAVEEVYFHTAFDPTTDDCGDPGYNNFEDLYFSHFNDSQGLFLRYVPIGPGRLLLELPSPGFGIEFQDSPFLGLKENPLEIVEIYPTIASEYVHISNPTSVEIEKVVVYNSLGQSMLTRLGDFDRIDLAALSKGVYFLQIRSRGGSISRKFIKR